MTSANRGRSTVQTAREWTETTLGSWLGLLAFTVAVLILPMFISPRLASEILILGLFGLSFNLMFGFSGILSFGHALFLGIGAYVAGFIVLELGWPVIAILAIAMLIGMAVGLVVGGLSLQLTGVYFAIVTLGFAQLGYELTFVFSDITGGLDGLLGIYRTEAFGLGILDISNSGAFYQFTALIVVLFVAFTYLLSDSMFGRTLQAIKENEERTKALGVNTYRVKVAVFTIASGIGAVAGALWGLYLRYVNPDVLWWTHSGDAIMYSLIGGMESIVGPVLGAGLHRGADRLLFPQQAGLWNVVMGLVFICIVLFARGGLVGVVEDAFEKLTAVIRSQSGAADDRPQPDD